jgi:hypothetical protein
MGRGALVEEMSWVTSRRVQHFRSVLKSMAIEMLSLAKTSTAMASNSGRRPFGLESSATLPLLGSSEFSSSHTSEQLTIREPGNIPSGLGSPSVRPQAPVTPLFKEIEVNTEASFTCLSETRTTSNLTSIELDLDGLPYQQQLHSKAPTIYLYLDRLFLICSCSSASVGHLPSGKLRKQRIS